MEVSRIPSVFLYHFGDETIISASNMRSRRSVIEASPHLCEKILESVMYQLIKVCLLLTLRESLCL